MIARLARKAAGIGIKLEVLQLTFCAGAVCGMIFEALVITVPKIAALIIWRLL